MTVLVMYTHLLTSGGKRAWRCLAAAAAMASAPAATAAVAFPPA
jgi:hypothetical protein